MRQGVIIYSSQGLLTLWRPKCSNLVCFHPTLMHIAVPTDAAGSSIQEEEDLLLLIFFYKNLLDPQHSSTSSAAVLSALCSLITPLPTTSHCWLQSQVAKRPRYSISFTTQMLLIPFAQESDFFYTRNCPPPRRISHKSSPAIIMKIDDEFGLGRRRNARIVGGGGRRRKQRYWRLVVEEEELRSRDFTNKAQF